MIDDVLTPQGLKTGQVRCIECGAVFDDPTANRETHDESETGRDRLFTGDQCNSDGDTHSTQKGALR